MISHGSTRVALGIVAALAAGGLWGDDTGQKNAPYIEPQEAVSGDSEVWVPGPGSKNFAGSDWASPGETQRIEPIGGSKNALADTQSGFGAQEVGTAVASVDYVCGSSGNLDWTTTSGTFEIVRQCTLTVPFDGQLFISANGSLFNSNGEYEAQFRIDVDSTDGDANIDRWVNVYNDSGDGSDRSMALSVQRQVGAGTHTIYLLGKRYAGPGKVGVHDPTLSAIFTPASRTCGASGNAVWTTTSASFQVVRQCTLTVPSDGFLLISADGSLRNYNGQYEGQFEIDIDSTVGDLDVDRWLNIYNDSVDGSDESVALTVRKPVTAGTHTVYYLGKRKSGPGQVRVLDPTLSATFVPASSSCGAFGNETWTTESAANVVIRQCTIEVSQAGLLFISADGSLFNSTGEVEGRFQIDIDSTAGDDNIDRWVNVYNDSGDGSDRSVALSVLKEVSAGTHTVYFLGRRSAGAGEVGVYDPTLSVWTANDLIFADGFESGNTSRWSSTRQ